MTTDNKALADRPDWMAEVCRQAAVTMEANGLGNRTEQLRNVADQLAALTPPQADKARGEADTLRSFVQRLECECDPYYGHRCARCVALSAAPQPQGDASPESVPVGLEDCIAKFERRASGFRSSEYGKGKQDGIMECVGDLRDLAQQGDASPEDDRFPGGFADAITYVDEMEEAAASLYQQVLGYETDGSDTGTGMLQTVARNLSASPCPECQCITGDVGPVSESDFATLQVSGGGEAMAVAAAMLRIAPTCESDWDEQLREWASRLSSTPQAQPEQLGDFQDKALAWDAVHEALTSVACGWTKNGSTGLQAAVNTINGMAGLGKGGRYWRERAEFWRAEAVELGWREVRDAANGEQARPDGGDGSLTYTEQRKVVEHMGTELRTAIDVLQKTLQRAEAIDCQPLVTTSNGGAVVYVECRQCDECEHTGINDEHPTDAACHDCDWSGPSPIEDKCPGCGDTDCMATACPKCGARYRLLAEYTHPAPAPDAANGVPITPIAGDVARLVEADREYDAAHEAALGFTEDGYETDSYGVYGSDFYRCLACDAESGAGILNKGVTHEAGCVRYRYEQAIQRRAEALAPFTVAQKEATNGQE